MLDDISIYKKNFFSKTRFIKIGEVEYELDFFRRLMYNLDMSSPINLVIVPIDLGKLLCRYGFLHTSMEGFYYKNKETFDELKDTILEVI